MLLAHAGGMGALLSLVTVLSSGIAVVFVLVAIGRIPLAENGDLVLPLASVAVVSSVAPLMGDLLSDAAAPAAMAGLALLLWLVVAANAPFDPRHPAALGAAVLAAVAAAVVLGPPLADGPWRETSDEGQQEAQRRAVAPVDDLEVPTDGPGQVPGGGQADPRG